VIAAGRHGTGSWVEVVVVDACLRDGAGGSPTAVVEDRDGAGDVDLVRIPLLTRTSHLAVVHRGAAAGEGKRLRFFTVGGELPACGHGTMAAIAVLSSGRVGGFQGRLRAGGRDFDASGVNDSRGNVVTAWFDQGHVEHRFPDAGEVAPFLVALGLRSQDLHSVDEPSVASPGRPRLLIPVADRTVLMRVRPDQERLGAASRRWDLLGCFVYVPPAPGVRACARMVAPAIGVPEDIANANSTGCLAAHLLVTGNSGDVEADQGDTLDRPSTVHAAATRTQHGIATSVGGSARVMRTVRLNLRFKYCTAGVSPRGWMST
jgi:trans-2,3-dihydro-3-hydroxyanthranilate isomerase